MTLCRIHASYSPPLCCFTSVECSCLFTCLLSVPPCVSCMRTGCYSCVSLVLNPGTGTLKASTGNCGFKETNEALRSQHTAPLQHIWEVEVLGGVWQSLGRSFPVPFSPCISLYPRNSILRPRGPGKWPWAARLG